ncbi:unnamed protein product [Ambrosiozyma monospora]|uniref:Unnamed protein product n=1 Tax=Ambrosiozyma monospora TaxID=43982 RepID=A0ACB5SW64_AMBMO|nr:unnamed protein product [Ambrosiozyma monospora]
MSTRYCTRTHNINEATEFSAEIEQDLVNILQQQRKNISKSQTSAIKLLLLDSSSKELPMSRKIISSSKDSVFSSGCRDVKLEMQKPRANAAFVVLARNSEAEGVVSSMKSLERHFNQWFNYRWIFLNNEEFDDNFKSMVSEVSSGGVSFGYISPENWDIPDEKTDPIYFKAALDSQGDREIMYGPMGSYHKMCRFYSGYFFNHPLVQELDWYWRVEPYVEFYCDLTYDPFVAMQETGKKYGFTIAIKELYNTVPNLFRYTRAFINKYNIQLPDTWDFLSYQFDFYEGKNANHYVGVRSELDLWKILQDRVPMYHALDYLKQPGADREKLDQSNGQIRIFIMPLLVKF